ncbi:hypothetical protein N7495_009174 [Penicillium taxi]|uniref:uncharacterized protein n=1 Tax=Penicillium taxi TaxID=168475 RepID=UPI00254572CA|nr:uncharacterized protein N7495_009174 [Penicillium taxi]KAJ5884664.1 hypothetical protein N7495_009174 [Penicillium taxi]
MSPIQLSTFPSSVDALSWSPDGDLAVAGGDHVRILTSTVNSGGTLIKQRWNQWHPTNVQTNRFTNAEWPTILTQGREDFSIAAEQSTSLTTAIAWSPSGLARYRRSVLAVLTSNLLLSIWEPAGVNGQWVRVCLVNHCLFATTPVRLEGTELRKVNIRSFKWCPPIRVSPHGGSSDDSDPESRWGIHLILVANDLNEVVLLQIRRRSNPETVSQTIITEKLATHTVVVGDGEFPTAGRGTLLYAALQAQARITALSCGPWIVSSVPGNNSVHTADTLVAVILANQLRLLKVTVTLTEYDSDKKVTPRFETKALFQEFEINPSPVKLVQHRLQGPLEWIYEDESPKIILAVCTNSDFITVEIPRSSYSASEPASNKVETWEWDISSLPAEDGGPGKPHYERVSGMTVSRDEHNTSTALNVGTHGGLGAVISLKDIISKGSLVIPQWCKDMNNFRDCHAQKQGWENLTVARIWGLGSWRSVTAVLFTTHPTDMIEYRIGTGNYSYIEIAGAWNTEMLFRPDPKHSDPEYARRQREKVITFVLSHVDNLNSEDIEDQKMVYHAACCAIADGQPEAVLSQARKCFERLAVVTGADMSEEMSKCGLKSAKIFAKRIEKQSQPGGHLFEWCGICGDGGIAWSAATVAQCVNGHAFARCGLSFQIIQSADVSKFCLACRKEYVDEDLVSLNNGPQGRLFLKEFHKFDTCIYCGGKFGPFVA